MSRVHPLVFLLIGISSHFQHAVAQTPVLHYTFDEPDGDAIDFGSGDPATGVFQSNATRTDNTPGGFSAAALDLSTEGLESWVNGGDAAKVDTLGKFTMTTWLNLQGLNSDQGGSGNVRLLAKQTADTFDGFSWNLNAPNFDDRSPDNFRLGMFVGGEDAFAFGQSTEDLGADNRWVFLAVTYDGEQDVDNMLFYTGDETASVAQLGESLSVFAGALKSSAGRATVNVGYTDAAPGNDFALNGYQDDIRIYDTILTAEQLETVRLENLVATLSGDFNGDSVLDAADIDALTTEVLAATNGLAFDLNGDQLVDRTDREVWVDQLKQTYFGDSNLDGEFNSSDFVTVFQAGEYEDAIVGNSTWATGDWNGDGEFDSGDFVAAFQAGGFEIGPRMAVSNIPEPSSRVLLLLAIFPATRVFRRRFV